MSNRALTASRRPRRGEAAHTVHLSDPVVEVAMQDLTRFVYRKERLYAPGGPFFGVRVIRGLTNPSHGVAAGKRYHTQPDPFGRHAYDHWCEQAGEAP